MHSREILTGRSSTFEGIAVENRKRMELMGIMPNNRAAEHALMQMMSCLGEMSTLAYRNATSLSPFEHNEVHSVIGKMAVCLATIGEAFDVPVGQAALDSIAEQIQKSGDTNSDLSKRDSKKHLSMQFLQESVSALEGRQKQLNVLLSPTSNRDFFSYLDELSTYGKGDFEKADLKWVAPSPGGTIQDLIENGSTINVKYEDLPKYLDLVKRYRSARMEDGQSKKPTVVAESSSGQDFKSSTQSIPLTSVVQGGGVITEDILFSPTHHDSNCFINPSSTTFPLNLEAATISSKVAPTAVHTANKMGNSDTVIGESSNSEGDFYTKVSILKRGNITGIQIAQLNLTFSIPRNGKLVELIPNGIHVRVTSANYTEFLRLLDDKSAIQCGRVRRLDSIKKLEVTGAAPQGLSREKEKFSPTHFSKDIFSPYEERTSFFIDCDASDEILPVFIKQREQQQKSSESEYVRVIRQGDVKKWMAIIEDAQRDPSVLKKYGVTFCIPSALVPDAVEEEQTLKLHELMKGGSTTPVEESQLWLFSRMIEQYLPASM